HLAKPADADAQAKLLDHEPGPYTHAALAEHLAAWKKFITGFDFQSASGGFLIPCPGNLEWGWPDGNKHSQNGPLFSPDTAVAIVNGWPCFHCFHAHCQGKTWKHLQDFYDFGRLFHRFEDWL